MLEFELKKNFKNYSAQASAAGIANQANTQFAPQVLNQRAASANTNPSDAQMQQILQLAGQPTGSTGSALNENFQNYNWNNYATPPRVQAAPAQAQNFQNMLSTGNPANVISTMQAWNSAAPFAG